jgi:predicted regulator of Ras-like GTPase activity (Roadblock/LC7/MglB family)
MTEDKTIQHNGQIGGVSLASFLQMLEQERKTCTLRLSNDDIDGCLFIEEGHLIDAECGDLVGQDAVHILLALENPGVKVTDAEDRLHRITQPLAQLLLNNAARIDEEKHSENIMKTSRNVEGSAHVKANPVIRRIIETLVDIAGVKHYYLLNRQGNMITQSSRNQKIGDFITYCIVSGIQIRKSLNAKGPHRIRLVMKNHEVLLILPGAGMIIGLLLDEHTSVSDVTARMRPALAGK